MHADRRINQAGWLVLVVLALAAVSLVRQQATLPGPRDAQALENPAESRLDIIAQLQELNVKMDRLIGLLESGKVKVTVANADQMRAEPQGEALGPAAEKVNEAQPRIIIRRKGD